MITSPRVEQVFDVVDRANYADVDEPYLEKAVPIGFNATISSPHIVTFI
jgi:protein-L-isoaspartate O-methyltransferase